MDRILRQLMSIDCRGDTLIATLDAAAGTTGLLIVSGGNEIRCGAHRGMALLATEIAEAGYPVLRYDRRGIGDSTGDNRGFRSAADDLRAAAAAFRAAMPQIGCIVGFGNCDAAATLALFGRDAGIDRVVLANPWVVEAGDDLPPAAAIRRRYIERLRRPSEWLRAVRGGVSFAKLFRGLGKIARGSARAGLETEVVAAIGAWGDRAGIVLARGDATAIAFADAARRGDLRVEMVTIETDSHSFAREADKAALGRLVLGVLGDAAG